MLNACVEPGRRLDIKTSTDYSSRIYNATPIPVPGGYRMYLCGFNGTNVRLLSAFSPDLENWCIEPGRRLDIKASTAYSINTDVAHPIVLPGGGVRVYFTAYDGTTYRILSAYSPDGFNFCVEPGRRLDIKASTIYDAYIYSVGVLVYPNGSVRLYVGVASSPNTGSYSIMSAYSPDGLNFCMEPGYRLDYKASTDYSTYAYISFPILLEGGAVRIFFTGGDGTNMRILSALSPDGLNFCVEPGRRLDILSATDYSSRCQRPFMLEGRLFFTGYDGTNFRTLSAKLD